MTKTAPFGSERLCNALSPSDPKRHNIEIVIQKLAICYYKMNNKIHIYNAHANILVHHHLKKVHSFLHFTPTCTSILPLAPLPQSQHITFFAPPLPHLTAFYRILLHPTSSYLILPIRCPLSVPRSDNDRITVGK